jgi:hypothetical protein
MLSLPVILIVNAKISAQRALEAIFSVARLARSYRSLLRRVRWTAVRKLQKTETLADGREPGFASVHFGADGWSYLAICLPLFLLELSSPHLCH